MVPNFRKHPFGNQVKKEINGKCASSFTFNSLSQQKRNNGQHQSHHVVLVASSHPHSGARRPWAPSPRRLGAAARSTDSPAEEASSGAASAAAAAGEAALSRSASHDRSMRARLGLRPWWSSSLSQPAKALSARCRPGSLRSLWCPRSRAF